MSTEQFPEKLAGNIKYYVYRLIDPRNGQTFYVGKGNGNRVFNHAQGVEQDPDDYGPGSTKERIAQIHFAGLSVGHIIHRHGMNERTALEVEAALIDCYQGLTNKQGGYENHLRGCRHADEILADHKAIDFEVDEPLIAFTINQMWQRLGFYEATRGVWKLNIDRARQRKLVLGVVNNVVKGVYRPDKWVEGTPENFHWYGGESKNRWGFVGVEAEPEVQDKYLGRRIPAEYRKRGVQTSRRYIPQELPTKA